MLSDAPQNIRDALKGEPVDFIVHSSSNYSHRKLGMLMLSGSVLFLPVLLFPLMFSFPLIEIFTSGSTHITVNGILQTYTRANPWGAIYFAVTPVFIVLFILIPMLIFFFERDKIYL